MRALYIPKCSTDIAILESRKSSETLLHSKAHILFLYSRVSIEETQPRLSLRATRCDLINGHRESEFNLI